MIVSIILSPILPSFNPIIIIISIPAVLKWYNNYNYTNCQIYSVSSVKTSLQHDINHFCHEYYNYACTDCIVLYIPHV